MTSFLSVSGLSKTFGTRRVLHDVSFDVRQGEVLGLIGPNGAGKTTLLECLAGLLPTNSGVVQYQNKSLGPFQSKGTLFYLPDAVLPWAEQTVKWVLKFFENIYGQSPGKLLQMFTPLRLEEIKNSRLKCNWSIVDDGGTKVLGVDGNQWLRGQPANGLAQNARAIYGSRHEEFIDNVKAFAYFPYAVLKEVDDFHDGTISMRFKLVAGQLDSCAGILFNLKASGDYLTVRFNGKEDNVVLWTFLHGKRSFVKKGTENVHLQFNTWHTLEVGMKGTALQASLDGKHLLDYTLAEVVSGRVGVWSKTDSVTYFDQYTVTR